MCFCNLTFSLVCSQLILWLSLFLYWVKCSRCSGRQKTPDAHFRAAPRAKHSACSTSGHASTTGLVSAGRKREKERTVLGNDTDKCRIECRMHTQHTSRQDWRGSKRVNHAHVVTVSCMHCAAWVDSMFCLQCFAHQNNFSLPQFKNKQFIGPTAFLWWACEKLSEVPYIVANVAHQQFVHSVDFFAIISYS